MALSDADHLVRTLGVGTVLCVGSADAGLATALRQRGAVVHTAGSVDELIGAAPAAYSYVVVEAIAMIDQGTLAACFYILRRLAPRWVVVRFAEHRALIRSAMVEGQRATWEAAAFDAGFRRAPQAADMHRFTAELADPLVPMLLEFELVPRADLAWPADITRQSGAPADAAMARCALAASLVREGDTVAVQDADGGAGCAIIAARSAAARVIGVIDDSQAGQYADANFGAQYGIDFGTTELAGLDVDSIDLLVAFNAPESEPEQSQFMEQVLRVLRPDGRLLVNATASLDTSDLIAEEYWSLAAEPRSLYKLAPGAPAPAGAKTLLVASVDPLLKYSERRFSNPEAWGREALPQCWVVAIAEHYDNPWLYRAMVRMGDRIRDRDALTDLAGRALGLVAMDSADFGGALTVLGYALLDQPSSEHVDDVLGLVDAYLAQDIDNPHVKRWQISSAFVAGRLAMARGERELARAYLGAVAQADFMAFGPLLATKTIAASFHLGAMALAEGDEAGAHAHFMAGVASCRRALHADDLNAIGDPEAPYSFGFTELGEVADMGAQCAMAAKLLALHARSPGLFWQKVDTRKFGLVSWALALEQEVERLRRQA